MKSIDNSDVKFPNLEDYNIDEPGELALYLAHCDFYPFRSVIENSKIILDAKRKIYLGIADKANEQDDFKTHCWAMNSVMISNSRVDLLTNHSLLLIMVSLLEESVNTLCRIYYNKYKIKTKLEEVKGSGLERAAEYIKNEVGIEGFKSGNWEYVTAIRDARNAIVHNGGRVIKDKDFKKFDKFSIGYREEDKLIYLENSDIVKIYNAIIKFMDKSFRLIPKESKKRN